MSIVHKNIYAIYRASVWSADYCLWKIILIGNDYRLVIRATDAEKAVTSIRAETGHGAPGPDRNGGDRAAIIGSGGTARRPVRSPAGAHCNGCHYGKLYI